MLETTKTKAYLLQMLSNLRFEAKIPSVSGVYRIFKAFSKIPVNFAEDNILFQCGVYNFTGKDFFHFEFVRQFTIYENGDYCRMEHLFCEFLFEPDKTLEELRTNLWSEECDDLDDFFIKIESLKEFQIPNNHYVPVKLNLDQKTV